MLALNATAECSAVCVSVMFSVDWTTVGCEVGKGNTVITAFPNASPDRKSFRNIMSKFDRCEQAVVLDHSLDNSRENFYSNSAKWNDTELTVDYTRVNTSPKTAKCWFTTGKCNDIHPNNNR